MDRQVNQLCGYPLFQLNLAIWLSQANPSFVVRPIFYDSGFTIYSIGPQLTVLPEIRLHLNESKIDCQDSSAPDMVLANYDRTKICILECKKNSFGVRSSTARQALSLLVISGPPVAEVLAIGLRDHSRGILTYLTKKDQTSAIQTTLDCLTKELAKIKIKTGESGCFGIGWNGQSITIEFPEDIKEIMNFKCDSPVEVLTVDDDTDPRPLYFIPYDPSAFNQQTGEEEKICRRILYERFLSHILSKTGSIPVPGEVVLPIDEILNTATFQLYAIWDDSGAKKHLKRLLKDFMETLLNSFDDGFQDYITFEPGKGWILKIKDHTGHEKIIKQITKFKPERMELDKKMMPGLFDD